MTKLWENDCKLKNVIENFTVGEDFVLDQNLIFYDCIGSIAHAIMLHKINILNKQEVEQLINELNNIISQKEKFIIKKEDEDVHTAVENFITKKLGDVGKKLHTARSRNDQVALDMRLFAKKNILELFEHLFELIEELKNFASKYSLVPIPGRTHFQRAMPSSVGLWAGAFMESLLDSALLLKNAYEINDQSPLGSAASYGVPLPIDRELTADLLGFSKVQNNVLYANNSRGKIESIIVHSLVQIMNDLSRFSTDVILFSAPEFGYFSLPKEICPGSSIMPQKQNPCVLELVRAKSAIIMGHFMQLSEITRALPSGYNRDLQETKSPVMKSFDIAITSVIVIKQIIKDMQVNKQKCIDAFSTDLFATDHVMELVSQGMPFRDAYKEVKSNLDSVVMPDPIKNISEKKHIGTTGNLRLELANAQIEQQQEWLKAKQKHWDIAISKLTERLS